MVKSGNYIGKIKEKEKYSVEQFAQISPGHTDVIWNIEQGKILPSKWELLQIAGRLGLDEKKLMVAHQQQLIAKGSEKSHTVSERVRLLERELQQWQKKYSSIKLFRVNGPLVDYLESIIYFESLDQSHAYEKVMPDGMSQLIINLDEPSSLVIGQHDIRSVFY